MKKNLLLQQLLLSVLLLISIFSFSTTANAQPPTWQVQSDYFGERDAVASPRTIRGLCLSSDGNSVYTGLIQSPNKGSTSLRKVKSSVLAIPGTDYVIFGNGMPGGTGTFAPVGGQPVYAGGATGTFEAWRDVGNSPESIDQDDRGYVYVALQSGISDASRVDIFTSDLSMLVGTINVPDPTGVHIYRTGGTYYAYVVSNNGLQRWNVTAANAPVLDGGYSPGVSGSRNLTVDADGTVFTVGVGANQVKRISAAGVVTHTTTITNAAGVAVFMNKIYIIKRQSPTQPIVVLNKADLTSGGPDIVTPALGGTRGTISQFTNIDVNASGQLYVSEENYGGAAATGALTSYTPPATSFNPAPGTISGRIYFDRVLVSSPVIPPVHNLTQNTFYNTIQAGVNAANPNDVFECANWTFNERVTVDRPLTIQGVDKTTSIVDGTGLAGVGSGFLINNGVSNVTIKNLTIKNFAGNSPNSYAGVYAVGGNNNLTVTNNIIKDNVGGCGIYANGPVNTVMIDGNTVSGHSNAFGAARGIVIWNGLKENITITNNEVFNNNCCGIELQDGSGTGVFVGSNNVHNNGDNGIGLIGLTGPGANLVSANSVANNGRFGIEIKNPNGSGSNAGPGSIVISGNTVSLTVPIGAEARDIAGISVYRRGVLAGNVDVPVGVVVNGNAVSGYTQPSVSEGFGIVVEGINHSVTGNTINGNDVGIQRQAGHLPYPGDGDQSNVADTYFGRGNSPVTCGVTVAGNTLSNTLANGVDTRDVGNSAGTGIVTNTNTGMSYCTIQAAIDDPMTLNGHTITVSAGTYNENVNVTKWLTLNGSGNSTVIQPTVAGPGISLNSPGTNAGERVIIKNLKITGATGGGNAGSGISILTGLGYLTFQGVSAVSNSGNGIAINHSGSLTDIIVDGCDLSNNGNDGFRIPTSLIGLDGLTITNTHLDGNGVGLAPNSGSGAGLDIFSATVAHPDATVVDASRLINNVMIQGCTFNNNLTKGIYAERLNNALIQNSQVSQSGVIGTTSPAGIDLNLKFNAFRNIKLDKVSVLNSAPNLAGIYAKARNDGGTYGPRPASLTDLVITGGEVSGSKYGIILENNITDPLAPGDQTQIHLNKIYNNSSAGMVNNIDGNKQVNGECNWWGASSGPAAVSNPSGAGNAAVNNIDFTPWLLAANSVSCNGGVPKLSTTINGVTVNSNNDGNDDLGAFSVCTYSNNIQFNSFSDQNGLSDPNLKVYQTYTASNVSVPFCNNCNATMAAFTGAAGTASLINPAMAGTLVMRFKAWVDTNGDNVVDPGEPQGDWIQYTMTINPRPVFTSTLNGITLTNNNDGADEAASLSVCNTAGDNLHFTGIGDAQGTTPVSSVKVKQETVRTNITFNGAADGVYVINSFPVNFDRNVSLVDPTMPGTLVLRRTIFFDANNNNILDANECANDGVAYTITVSPHPALQTTVNGVTLTNNNDGADETTSFVVCNTNGNLHFTQFIDAAGISPSSSVKVIQQFTRTNVAFGPNDGTFTINDFTPYTPFDRTVSLINPTMSGTLVMRFRTFFDNNGNNVIDGDECPNDWVVYTVHVDGEAPVLTVPANVSANCSSVPPVGIASVTDDLDPNPTVVYLGETRVNGSCNGNYTLTRTWKATDACGNSSTKSQTITVSDTQAPTLVGTLPGGAVGNVCQAGAPAAPTPALIASKYTDNCSGVVASLLSTVPSGNNCAWSVTYTYSIKDGCNNAAANAVVTYTGGDTQAPTQASALPGGAVGSVCKSAAPAAPSVTTIASKYTDNCSTVTATLLTSNVTGTDCSWTATYTYAVKDACNNAAANAVVVYTGGDVTKPTFTRPADITILFTSPGVYNASPAVTGDVTNEADNCSVGLNATYTDATAVQCGNNLVITRTWHLVDNCGNAAPDQVQTITVTDNNTQYIIYATTEVKFGEDNLINGDVGVTDAKGKADFKKGDILDPYTVRAKTITVQLPSSVNNKVLSPATGGPNPPFQAYVANPLSGNYTQSANGVVPAGNYKNLTIKAGVTATVNGSNYGKITLEEGANVTFASSNINMEELAVGKGKKGVATTNVYFNGITAVKVSQKVTIEEDCRINVGGPIVTFYLGDAKKDEENFMVKGDDTQVTLNIMIPNGKLKIDKKTDNCIMTGWFIIEKMESTGATTWNKYGCGPLSLTQPQYAKGAEQQKPEQALIPAVVQVPKVEVNENFKVNVYPNPSAAEFSLQVTSKSSAPVTVRILDMNGVVRSTSSVVSKTNNIKVGTGLLAGTYMAEVTQGANKQVVRLVKIN